MNIVTKTLWRVVVKRNGQVKYRFTVAADEVGEAHRLTKRMLTGDDREYGEIFATKMIKNGLPVAVTGDFSA